MSDATVEEIEEEPKSSKLPLILGLVALLLGGGGGFFATFSGMLMGEETQAQMEDPDMALDPIPDVAFVPLDPMVVSIGKVSDGRHLRFRAQLEVPSKYQSDVQELMPRIIDVLNSYLRALELSDLENTAVLTRLRAQMLRRIQVVTGMGRVNDFLIMEFVLN